MQKIPSNIKNNKSHKVKNYKGTKSANLSFFKSGFKIKNIRYLSWNNFESFRKVYVRAFRAREIKNKKNFKLIRSAMNKRKKKVLPKKKVNQLIFRAHFWSPLTKKPLQVRMGKGKGNVYKWVFPCNSNKILFEQLTTIRKKKVFRAFNKALKKIPARFKYINPKEKLIFPRRYKNAIFKNIDHLSFEEVLIKLKNKLIISKTNEY